MRRDLAGSWFDKATPFLRRGHDFDLESSVGKVSLGSCFGIVRLAASFDYYDGDRVLLDRHEA